MFSNGSCCSIIREALVAPHNFRNLLGCPHHHVLFHALSFHYCGPRSCWTRLASCFSSLPPTDPSTTTFPPNSNIRGHRVERIVGTAPEYSRVPSFFRSDVLDSKGVAESNDSNEAFSDCPKRLCDDDTEIRILSFKNQRHLAGFWRVLGDGDEFRHPLVKEVCRLIQLQSAWTPELERRLKHLLKSLKPRQVCAVLCLQEDERSALKFFYWADRQRRYRHDPLVYYTMLEVLGKTKLCQGASRVLRLMARRGVECRPEAYRHVMVSYSRAGKLRKAMLVLTLMQRAGVGPNLSICNTAINILIMDNRLDKAMRYLERMQLVGIAPNVVTYNCLIKGLCDLHRVEDALGLIAEMPLKGCSPDNATYCTVMGFLCKENRVKELRELMEKMSRDSNLLPDMVTYHSLIHMLSNSGHGNEALEFIREAEVRGFRINKKGYSTAVHSFCRSGELERAKDVVNEMILKGCVPDVVTYTTIVDGFCRAGKMDQAKRMFDKMRKHGCKPNTVTYTAFFNGLCRNGNSSEAREMMKISEEELWTPNAITYGVLIRGFCREENFSEACDMVREMISRSFLPAPAEINSLIQSLCRVGKTVEAKKLLVECQNKGCAINAIHYTTVIHGFCKKDDLDAAFSLFDDMYLTNKRPDSYTYTTLIDALGRKGRIEEATELTKKMLRSLSPTPVTYRTVIHHFCNNGRVEDLLRLLENMLSREAQRTAYNQVIEKLCDLGNLEEAYKLLGKVLKTASRIDANTCHVLMESYLNKGNPLVAYKVACRMFTRNLIPDLKVCVKVCKKLMLEGKSGEADKLMLKFVERGCNSHQCQQGLQSKQQFL